MTRKPSPESTRTSIRSSASTHSESMRSFSFSSHRCERPASPESTHGSIRSASSTARPSIYSHASEKDPLLPTSYPTFTINPNERGEQELKYHGEQIWEPKSNVPGGQRIETKHQRGCVMPRATLHDQANWKRKVQDILGYDFKDADLLEEALESEGSEVTSVGKTHRKCLKGNTDLAHMGHAVMRLVLREQCYIFPIHEDDADKTIKKLIEKHDELYQLGMATKLQQYIRPRAPLRPSQKWSITANIKEEFKGLGKDAPRVIATGIKAIIGAVHLDSGLDSARRVMVQLEVIIKLPEPKPAPVPDFGHTIRYAKGKGEDDGKPMEFSR